MHPTQNSNEKIALFLKIFFPILIYQLANYSASFIDTMMTGQYSTVDLAGVSIATSLWNPFFSLVTGMVAALVPIVGQHLGRGKKEEVRNELHQFVYLSLLLSLILLVFIYLGAIPLLNWMHLETQVLLVAKDYLHYILIGILPFLLFSVFRSFFDALGLTKLSMYLMLLLVPFNSFFNYVLIYGKFAFPELGGAGAGFGTSLAYWALLLVVLAVLFFHPSIKEYRLWQIPALDKKLIRADVHLGLPIGLQIFAEVAIFAVVGLLMAKFSSQTIAAHQSAMNFATLLYAFPASISTALAIVVAYEIGAKRQKDVEEYSRLGRLIAFVFAFGTLSFLFLFRQEVARLYGNHPDFIKLTSTFLSFALFFQLADAYAAPIQGILRGYKDTRMPFVLGVASYWSVSLPVGFFLETTFDLGPRGYWIGLILGIAVCGFFLDLRLKKVKRNSPIL